MLVSEQYSGKWMKAENLNGTPLVVVIESVGLAEFDDGKKQMTLKFQGHDNQLGLNVTNANMMATLLGNESDNWINHQIEVYPTTTEFGGKPVPCIRVRGVGQANQPQYNQAPVQQPAQQQAPSQAPANPTPPGPAPLPGSGPAQPLPAAQQQDPAYFQGDPGAEAKY